MDFYMADALHGYKIIVEDGLDGDICINIDAGATVEWAYLTRDQALAMADAIKRFYGEGKPC